MVSIYEAVYINGKEKALISLDDINTEDYLQKYREKLFCTTTNCKAKLSYVNRPGNRSHFRTWRESQHSESCIHFFEKKGGRIGVKQSGVQTGSVSTDQMRRSVREAFELEMLSEEERVRRREADRKKRQNRTQRRKVTNTIEQPEIRIVTDPTEKTEDSNGVNGRLYKRNADALKETDLGHTRTVTGIVKSVKTGKNSAQVRVYKNGRFVNIKFEEAFFAATPQYEGLFHYIDRFAEENNNVIFCAVGEIRRSKQSGEFEIVVFDREGLLIHGRTLPSLAASYSIEQI
ncbi:hypothetical protein ABE060_17085 [Bacillus rugosus]|uniref:hypothetical protein n=1 Tax=Bacillus rugosus TaxID=2715209 RepID=UPI00141F03F2|nr:hypothetical protein [Bacillus rugosus]NUF04882.1 hypothetical protein [Bacillus rugosus]